LEGKEVDEILKITKAFLAGEYDPLDFSYDLPDMLAELYDELEKESREINAVLQDNLPEICADYEIGADPVPFRNAVRAEFKRAGFPFA
jgi:hypothetical protein